MENREYSAMRELRSAAKWSSIPMSVVVASFAALVNLFQYEATSNLLREGLKPHEVESAVEYFKREPQDFTGRIANEIYFDIGIPGRELAYVLHRDSKKSRYFAVSTPE